MGMKGATHMKTYWIELTNIRTSKGRGFYATAKNKTVAIAAAMKYGKPWEIVTKCEVQK